MIAPPLHRPVWRRALRDLWQIRREIGAYLFLVVIVAFAVNGLYAVIESLFR
jgi:hypothetical protein